MNKFLWILLWIWQLPQNIAGIIMGFILSKRAVYQRVSNPWDLKGYSRVHITLMNGGMTLGEYIYVSNKFNDLVGTVKHETGHVRQSRILGPLYLLVIGIPSIIHAKFHKRLSNKRKPCSYWPKRYIIGTESQLRRCKHIHR